MVNSSTVCLSAMNRPTSINKKQVSAQVYEALFLKYANPSGFKDR